MAEDVKNPSLGLQVAAWCWAAGWRGQDLRTAIAVAKAESGYRQDAKNVNTDRWHSTDWGIFQINDHYHPVTDTIKQKAESNVRYAHVIWTGADKTFRPWVAFTSGSYKKNLAEADELATLVEKTPSLQRLEFNENDGTLDPPSIDLPSIGNPLDALGAIPRVLARVSSDIIMVLLILVLLILGILMVSGKLGKLASVTPMGKTASVARKALA